MKYGLPVMARRVLQYFLSLQPPRCLPRAALRLLTRAIFCTSVFLNFGKSSWQDRIPKDKCVAASVMAEKVPLRKSLKMFDVFGIEYFFEGRKKCVCKGWVGGEGWLAGSLGNDATCGRMLITAP